jgi:hypothetical protein
LGRGAITGQRLEPHQRRDDTTIMILAMMRSIVMQHLDFVPKLRGVGSAVNENLDRRC